MRDGLAARLTGGMPKPADIRAGRIGMRGLSGVPWPYDLVAAATCAAWGSGRGDVRGTGKPGVPKRIAVAMGNAVGGAHARARPHTSHDAKRCSSQGCLECAIRLLAVWGLLAALLPTDHMKHD